MGMYKSASAPTSALALDLVVEILLRAKLCSSSSTNLAAIENPEIYKCKKVTNQIAEVDIMGKEANRLDHTGSGRRTTIK